MCGIAAYSSNKPFNKEKMQLLMLWNGFSRGEDATGVYSLKNGLIKDNKHVGNFLIDNDIQEDNTFIAHVRAKTVGANLKKNSHPFEEDNIILLHNGTLTNHYALAKKYNIDYTSYEVDSELICKIINKEKNFKVLSEIDGGAAFIIVNKTNPDIMYTFRNDKRPLFRGNFDGGIYISSIAESLQLIGCNNIKEFKPDYLYTIQNGLIKGSPIKIANKPFSYHNNNSNAETIYNDINIAIGCRLRCDNVNIHNIVKDGGVTLNKYYLIKAVENTEFIIEDNFGKDIKIHKYNFDTTKDFFTKGNYIKATSNLRKAKNKTETPDIKKDDVLCVVNDYKNGKCKGLLLRTNEYFVISKEDFITCNNPETNESYNNSNEELIEFNFNNENTSFEGRSFNYDNAVDDETPEDNGLEDNEEDDYFNILLNKELLLEDFEDLKSSVEELYPHLPNNAFIKTIKQEIEEKFDECINLYSLVEENA